MEPKNSGTRPASVPGGLAQPGAPGGPGQPPPGSIPTGELLGFVLVYRNGIQSARSVLE